MNDGTELQRDGVARFTLSRPGHANSILAANNQHRLAMHNRADLPRGVKYLWGKDTGASNRFTNEDLFAIQLQGTRYYLSRLPNNMLELKLVLVKPQELVCEALQWEETEGGVIREPAVRPLPRIIN